MTVTTSGGRSNPRHPLPAPDRWHLHLVAPAGAAIDFLAAAELQILAHADPYFAEPGLVAGHRDRSAVQPGIGLDEGVLDLGRRNGLRLRQLEIFFGYFDGGARLADGLEVGPRTQPRTGAVLVPLGKDLPARRHQIQHRRHDVAIEPGRRPLAIIRKAMLVLGPQPVHHEGKPPPAALDLRTSAPAALRCRLAERRRP